MRRAFRSLTSHADMGGRRCRGSITLVSAPSPTSPGSTSSAPSPGTQHEHDPALALRGLLVRAAAGQGTRREKVIAARAHTAKADGTLREEPRGERLFSSPSGPSRPTPTAPDPNPLDVRISTGDRLNGVSGRLEPTGHRHSAWTR